MNDNISELQKTQIEYIRKDSPSRIQFVDGTRNLWGQGQCVGCSEKWVTKNICGKHCECKTIA